MTKSIIYTIIASVFLIYIFSVFLFGFPGVVALSLHFVRITVTIAGLILYLRMMATLFEEVPPPRRDYLLLGINFMLLSAVCFSFWNEVSRIWNVDSNVFSSYISGLFSLFLVVGSTLVIVAPDTQKLKPKIIAVIIGLVLSVGLVLIAPLFR